MATDLCRTEDWVLLNPQLPINILYVRAFIVCEFAIWDFSNLCPSNHEFQKIFIWCGNTAGVVWVVSSSSSIFVLITPIGFKKYKYRTNQTIFKYCLIRLSRERHTRYKCSMCLHRKNMETLPYRSWTSISLQLCSTYYLHPNIYVFCIHYYNRINGH